jgi:hypothetical protein
MERIKHERTEDLAREVLRDLKCLEHARFQCAWTGRDPKEGASPKELLIPSLIIVFDYPPVPDIAPALCIRFSTRGFANGSLVHDAQIKYVIRSKVEKYLKAIGQEPGVNSPQDLKLIDNEMIIGKKED